MDFVAKFTELVTKSTLPNEERAVAVENFLLHAAVTAGVVKKVELRAPRNPNKWGKTLAPWFNDKCRAAKVSMG